MESYVIFSESVMSDIQRFSSKVSVFGCVFSSHTFYLMPLAELRGEETNSQTGILSRESAFSCFFPVR